MWCIYTMEYYSVIKKNKIMPFATTWMDLESIILNEVSQRRRNISFSDIYIYIYIYLDIYISIYIYLLM